jgi:hypothetical protein
VRGRASTGAQLPTADPDASAGCCERSNLIPVQRQAEVVQEFVAILSLVLPDCVVRREADK